MTRSATTREQTDTLAKLAGIPPAGSEERKAWLARAEQAGAILYNDRTRTLLAAEGAILALMSAARRQGQRDVLEAASFQERNEAWMAVAFADDPTDLPERVARFGEESLELQQALGQTREDAHRLVDYVYDRPIGRADKEMGGTLTTLACLAVATGLDMATCGEDELARVSSPEFIAKLRGKRATRHGRGPLPGFSAPATPEVPPSLSPDPITAARAVVEEKTARMTVVEAREVLDAIGFGRTPQQEIIKYRRASLGMTRPENADKCLAKADRIELALSTIKSHQEKTGEVQS